MGVSIYYTAYREHGLSPGERSRVEEIATVGTTELFSELNRRIPNWQRGGIVPTWLEDATELCEGLSFYPEEHVDEGSILSGSSKVSHTECESDPMWFQVEYYMSLLGRIREAVPGADWHVHLDDVDLVWDQDNRTYEFP